MRVPSSCGSLERARARGRASPHRLLAARRAGGRRAEPGRSVVFLAVGFETTVPTIVAAVAEAEGDGVGNF